MQPRSRKDDVFVKLIVFYRLKRKNFWINKRHNRTFKIKVVLPSLLSEILLTAAAIRKQSLLHEDEIVQYL